jgi:branched-chain amino acid transport system permease protein
LGYLFQILLNSAHNGALYALLAYGYVLTYQVTKRANFAHGALFAFTGQNLILFTAFGWNTLWLIFPLALAFGTAMACALSLLVLLLLARIVFPPLIDRSPNTMIAASLGVSICLMELARLAAGTRDLWLPQVLSKPINLGGVFEVTLTQNQIVNVALIIVLLVTSEITLRRSKAGRQLRAVSDDPLAAELMGISKASVFSASVMAGGLYAMMAGILAAIYFGNIGFGAGMIFGLKVLFIAAAGGFTVPLRAAAGAFLVGVAEALWDGYFPTIYRDAVIYCALACLLVIRADKSDQKRLP